MVQDIASNLIDKLYRLGFETVWTDDLTESDRRLSLELLPTDSCDFLVVRDGETIVIKEYPDGWDYYLIGEPTIELPSMAPDSLSDYLAEMLPSIQVIKTQNPQITPLHSEFLAQIDRLCAE